MRVPPISAMLGEMSGRYPESSRRRAVPIITVLVAVAGGLAVVGGLTLAGSGATASGVTSTLTVSASTIANGSNVTFTYSTPKATVKSTNWIGIYQSGQIPGQVASTTWQYAPGASGSLTFSTTSLSGVGRWQGYYLYDNGYKQLAGPVDFSVIGEPPAPAPRFLRALSPRGFAALADPFGVALDAHGDLWVADTGHNRVEELSPTGQLLASSRWGDLYQPEGVAVDRSGNIWVTDTGHNRVVELSPDGSLLAVVGGAGAGDGQFDSPTAITVSPLGDVYVADQGNNRVEEFSPSGSYLSSVSVATPDGVAVNPRGDVWVSSPSYADGNAVYEFSPAGSLITSFGSTQASYGALSNPAAIALGHSGRIYVVQPDYSLVTVFNPDGSFHTEFGLKSRSGGDDADLESPQGIAISRTGDIWIADSGNNRVVEYGPTPASHEAPK
jgi:streptogramin lyase